MGPDDLKASGLTFPSLLQQGRPGIAQLYHARIHGRLWRREVRVF